MATIKEEAQAYVPPQTLNIADLPEVPINELQVLEDEAKDADGIPFNYKYFELNGNKYRVPNKVLEEVKKMLKLKPDLAKIKVKRTGSGLGTRYEVEAV